MIMIFIVTILLRALCGVRAIYSSCVHMPWLCVCVCVCFSHRDGDVLIYVMTLTRKIIALNCFSTETIMTVKLRVCDQEGIPVDQQRLVFVCQLEDDRTLEDYKIQPESMIRLILRCC
jgi:hypothetical protein